MHDQRSLPRPSGVPDAADRRDQLGVLVTVIDLHPVQVTFSELLRELVLDPDDFDECDRVKRAVRDLAGVGLLHQHDFRKRPNALVVPTRVALRASELLADDE